MFSGIDFAFLFKYYVVELLLIVYLLVKRKENEKKIIEKARKI